jgi:hypothetical protein
VQGGGYILFKYSYKLSLFDYQELVRKVAREVHIYNM